MSHTRHAEQFQEVLNTPGYYFFPTGLFRTGISACAWPVCKGIQKIHEHNGNSDRAWDRKMQAEVFVGGMVRGGIETVPVLGGGFMFVVDMACARNACD